LPKPRNPQPAEEPAHVDEQLRLLHRGEVSAARHLGELHEVVLPLDPLPGDDSEGFPRKARAGERRLDAALGATVDPGLEIDAD
jgi:hypothetical protein